MDIDMALEIIIEVRQMGKLNAVSFSKGEQRDLAENITVLASMVKFASKGLNLPKQELLTQIHGKLIDLREMVYQNETVASIEIKLAYQE